MWVFAQYQPIFLGFLWGKGAALQLSSGGVGGGWWWAAVGATGGIAATGRESVPSESVRLLQEGSSFPDPKPNLRRPA